MDSKPSRWTVLVAVATALWSGFVFVAQHKEHDKAAADSERIRIEQASLNAKYQQFQDVSSRQKDQLSMLPSTIQLLREQKCDSDFLALILLDELRAYLRDTGGAAQARVGVDAQRATLKLLIARQRTSKYCPCETLTVLASLQPRDADIADLVAELARVGEENGCGGNTKAGKVLAQVQTKAAQSDYYVVFGNDTDCAAAQTTARLTREALRSVLKNAFEEASLKLLKGTYHRINYLVTVYGGTLNVREAADLIQKTQSMPNVRNDLYWASASNYSPLTGCSPAAAAAE